MKRLVVYYSVTENTKRAAETVAQALGADILRVETVKKLPTEQKKLIAYGGMLTVFGMKPALKQIDVNFDDYDEIILGAPVWAGKVAAPLNSLLKNSGFVSKLTAVFTLSGSGNNESTVAQLKKKAPKLTHSVSLIDAYNEKSADNDAKLAEFIEEIK